MAATPRRVGVVIRTLNESELIATCLEMLARQQPGFDLDVVVVDSGSTDATVELARAGGARIIEIDPADFDYSKALNVGLEQLDAELAVLLSAHAIPVDDHWLERMTAPFSDPRVAGVSSRQIPWPGAPWWETERLRRAFGDATTPYEAGAAENIVFSNAASCVRLSSWRAEPFTLPAAEDLEWAERVVAAGWKVVYEAGAAVYHSHDEGPRAQARRMIDINRVHSGQIGRARVIRQAAGLLARNAISIARLDEPWRRKPRHLAELLHMVWFYVVDFDRSGTTAERRRADLPSPGGAS
jgi:GT2 family glycosyltransferase